MIQTVLVLGAGSAGLLAALSLKRKIPDLTVRVVRSPEIGVIGVGEGTTPNLPRHLFDYLGLGRKRFYALAQPTWKLGIRFLWGPRDHFHYGFGSAMDLHFHELPRPNGFYCDDEFRDCDMPTALMAAGKVFARQPNNGGPDVQGWHAFHIENKLFVQTLESAAVASGVEILDGKVCAVEKKPDEEGIQAVTLEDGQRLEADFFVDASGFRSELIGRALGEPFVSYDNALFCDRAVIGGWERTDEPILPYTTAETMDAGWSWQIEHERHINRGYVYSSAAISDDDARAEFLRKNPKAPEDGRIVKFRSGHYRRGWVGNVVAVGNAAGFVEPLEATALMVVCSECQTIVDILLHSERQPTPGMARLFNKTTADAWDEIRDFLALHYKLNTRLDTPFWRHCREDTELEESVKEAIAFYEENGPTGFLRHMLPREGKGNFGLEGWLVMLVGNRTNYQRRHVMTPPEQKAWEKRCKDLEAVARNGMSVKEALGYVHHPKWQWVEQRQ